MAITREEVEHVAHLARLGLTEEEVERMAQQLSHILDNFESLKQVDTSAISPTAQVITLQNVMRTDEVRPSFPREEILANAPRAEDGCFRVKAILE